MSESGVRKDNYQSRPINCLAQVVGTKPKLSFNGLYDEQKKCVPDKRCLQRNPWAIHDYVYVTQTTGEVEGIVFCNFRKIEPKDVTPCMDRAFGVPLSEQLTFQEIKNGIVVLGYQCKIAEFFWEEDDVIASDISIIEINPQKMGIQFERRERSDSRENGFAWNLSCNREFVDLFGGLEAGHHWFNEDFFIKSALDNEAMLAICPDRR